MKTNPVMIGYQKSDEVQHQKHVIDGVIFYVAQYPEGDYSVHRSDRCKDGYGGQVVSFLLTDGSIENVKGPFSLGGSANFIGDQKRRLAEMMGVDESDLDSATKLTIGNNLWSYTKAKEIVFQEVGFRVGDWRRRLKDEWRGFEVKIECRHVGYLKCVSQVLNSLGQHLMEEKLQRIEEREIEERLERQEGL